MRNSLVLLLALLGLAAAAIRYDNYKVIRFTPKSEKDLVWLSALTDAWENRVDFWRHATCVGNPVDVMVAPHWQSEFLHMIKNQGMDYKELIKNVQDLLTSQEETLSRKRRSSTGDAVFDYTTYHTVDEIYTWIADFVNENSGIASMEQLSTSYEGRPIQAVKLGTPKVFGEKPIAYIQGGIHAREWVSPATMMFLIKKLKDSYGTDTTITAMLDAFDFYIVPVLNPDGYSYTWTNDRMWRKNRRKHPGDTCIGIDLNRNYDYAWGGRGASPLSCSETYHGPSPLSEPEHQGVTSFLLDRQKTHGVHLFMDFHSYGQYWLYPWGYTGQKDTYQPARDQQHSLAMDAKTAIMATNGKDYFVGESGPDMYPAAGGSEDWGYGSLGAQYTFIVELRDEGEYGFLLPETQIEPTAEEIFAAIRVVCGRLVSEFSS